MKTLISIFVNSAIVLFSAFSLTACAYSGGPVEGKVLEEGTNKPISGAIVVVRWEGSALGFDTRRVCIHVESATTDEQGRYRIPAWRASVEPKGVRNLSPNVTAYKIGYQWSDVALDKAGVEYLKPIPDVREERFKAARIAGVKCPGAGESQKNLIRLYRTIYDQLSALAVTKEEKTYAIAYLNAIDVIELPYDEAIKRDLERREALRHEKE